MTAPARVGLWFSLVATSLACSWAIGVYVVDAPSRRTIAHWEHPICAQDGSRLQLVVEEHEGERYTARFTKRTYMVYLGGEFPYGFWGRLPFYDGDSDAERLIAASHVEWTEDAAIFVATTGERLSISYAVAGEEPPR